MAARLVFVLLTLAAALGAPAAALTYCAGTLSGNVSGDVAVTSGSVCALSANVSGDVYARNGSRLSLRDGAVLWGSVFFNESSHLDSSGSVVVKGGAGINGESGDSVRLAGALTAVKVDLKNSTDVSLTGVNVHVDGVKVEIGRGDLRMCGCRVKNVLEFKGVDGNFYAVQGPGCERNFFYKDIKMEGVVGNVTMDGSHVATGEFTAKQTDGALTLRNMKVFKMKIELNYGAVSMYNVKANEAEVKECYEGVSIDNSKFGKIGCFVNSPSVTGSGNDIKLGEGQCTSFMLS